MEVHAARDGQVVQAGIDPVLGNVVVLAHEGGYQTVYGHLRVILVALNQQVRSGMIIGEVGSTGRSTGAHLHFEVRRKGSSRDPLPLLPPGKSTMSWRTVAATVGLGLLGALAFGQNLRGLVVEELRVPGDAAYEKTVGIALEEMAALSLEGDVRFLRGIRLELHLSNLLKQHFDSFALAVYRRAGPRTQEGCRRRTAASGSSSNTCPT